MAKGRDGNEASDHWKTPAYIYDPLNEEFQFDFDPCPLNHDMSWDGLNVEWGLSNWHNPPYNRIDKPRFIEKSYREWFYKKKTVVSLLPSVTGSKHFHKYILPDSHSFSFDFWLKNKKSPIISGLDKIILYVEGRVPFEGYNTKGEFTTTGKGKHDSMILIFKGDKHKILTP
jgi:hypothetical protein